MTRVTPPIGRDAYSFLAAQFFFLFRRSTDDPSTRVECEAPVFIVAKSSLAHAAISLGLALSAENGLTNPAVHPLA
jgi:hypothetical protein